jgi:hypothetical protein
MRECQEKDDEGKGKQEEYREPAFELTLAVWVSRSCELSRCRFFSVSSSFFAPSSSSCSKLRFFFRVLVSSSFIASAVFCVLESCSVVLVLSISEQQWCSWPQDRPLDENFTEKQVGHSVGAPGISDSGVFSRVYSKYSSYLSSTESKLPSRMRVGAGA